MKVPAILTISPNSLEQGNNNFDFLRLIGAFLVFFGHAVLITQPSILKFEDGIAFGVLGVNIFFILSGFLITKSWFSSGSSALFLKKRILRIYPALIFTILFSVLIIGPIGTFLTVNTYFHAPGTLSYLNNIFLVKLLDLKDNVLPGVFVFNKLPLIVNASLWTIPVEVGCYMLVLFFGLRKLFRKRIIFLLLLASLLFLSIMITLRNEFQLYLQTNFRPPIFDIIRLTTYFFSGIVLYLYREIIVISKKYFYIIILILASSIWFNYFGLLSYFLLPVVVIFVPLLNFNFPKKITRYGDFSYGFYLFAFPVQQTVAYLLGKDLSLWQHLLFSFFPIMFLAILSWNFIEKPFLKLKHHSIIKSAVYYLYKKIKMV